MDYASIAVAVLAAGQGGRFGSDKLMADLDGIPLGIRVARTIAQMSFGWRFAVCAKGAALVQHFADARFQTLENDAPERGQSHSLQIAVRAAEATDARALLILLADMPFVSAKHVAAVADHDDLTASTDGQKPMPPALFPRSFWPDLLQTSGDAGARVLLTNANLVTAPAHQLRDIDVVADMPRSQA